ncbi:Uncharacterised protein [Campylobacter hyointestinalis subsp. hyointestinalis]|uniref:Uncharacterized protein n=1 Tax=Campylobacter hyointestinalis subsp. hyointestinalis TaxID=91352 RepID=A0A9W5ES60_CAMHY|nr:hypothetical protein [Campylobacter hyointestinalis]CUU79249.1 Uncharacterised protein [Campylobacter hyointestinalis subsp. hyointestinalis]
MTTKEKEQPKFKVGDKIIHNVLCNGTPLKECNFKIVEHIDLSNGSYEIYDKELNNFEFLKIKTADRDIQFKAIHKVIGFCAEKCGKENR